jgi:hypothetical protein
LKQGEVPMRKEVDMKCSHCNSAMNYQKFYNTQGYFWGWRCICCGEILDPVILENRRSLNHQWPRKTMNGRG